MDLTIRHEGTVTIVDLAGPITFGEGDAKLRESLFRLLESDHRHILLNLENVSHVDSAALGELGASLKRAREKKGELKLLSPSRKVVEILRLVRFDALFDIHDDEREAIASFSRSD
jgi:anti-sigma B factor antagonist